MEPRKIGNDVASGELEDPQDERGGQEDAHAETAAMVSKETPPRRSSSGKNFMRPICLCLAFAVLILLQLATANRQQALMASLSKQMDGQTATMESLSAQIGELQATGDALMATGAELKTAATALSGNGAELKTAAPGVSSAPKATPELPSAVRQPAAPGFSSSPKATPELPTALKQPVKLDPHAKSAFDLIYRTNRWGSRQSLSGPGSEVGPTTSLRSCIGNMIRKYNWKVFMDLPCGDANWQGLIPGLEQLDYFGFDIAQQALDRAMTKNKDRPHMKFRQFDLGSNVPMKADVHMIKDVVQHWPLDFALKALRNAKASGTRYLLGTTFESTARNKEIRFGDFYKANLEIAPFRFPPAIERCEPQFDKPWATFGASMRLYDLQAWDGGGLR